MQISELNSTTDRQLAYGLLRLILGTNILIHGVSRMYMGVKDFAQALVPLFAKTQRHRLVLYMPMQPRFQLRKP